MKNQPVETTRSAVTKYSPYTCHIPDKVWRKNKIWVSFGYLCDRREHDRTLRNLLHCVDIPLQPYVNLHHRPSASCSNGGMCVQPQLLLEMVLYNLRLFVYILLRWRLLVSLSFL